MRGANGKEVRTAEVSYVPTARSSSSGRSVSWLLSFRASFRRSS
jgi:hypothetical protein